MKLKLKALTAILLTCITLFACVFVVSGCKPRKKTDYRIDFNAEFISIALKKEFTKEHLIRDLYGIEPEIAKDLPYDRTIVIDTKEMADEIYASHIEVDYTKEMLVLYIYPSYNEIRRSLKDVRVEDGALKITFETISKSSSEEPVYRLNIMALKMDKTEYDTVSVDSINRYGR